MKRKYMALEKELAHDVEDDDMEAANKNLTEMIDVNMGVIMAHPKGVVRTIAIARNPLQAPNRNTKKKKKKTIRKTNYGKSRNPTIGLGRVTDLGFQLVACSKSCIFNCSIRRSFTFLVAYFADARFVKTTARSGP